ncbi:hypothetical protein SCUCBS95973_004954 [Sporothrix curviconia]|uniref:M protein repeat protein n=1 Tax=Sporothrix curviconia TaxID=1260050 RepID=A0ABP0BUV8_9PEZI
MADEDKAKAEKLAAAKKRVEALKKKKQTGGGASAAAGKKGAKKDKAKEAENELAEEKVIADNDKEDAAEEDTKEEPDETTEKADKGDVGAAKSDKKKKKKKGGKKDDKEEKEEAGDEADKAEEDDDDEEAKDDDKDEEDDTVASPASPKAAPPSLSEQSRLRSTSFRHGGPGPSGPLSPSADGETAADIYRKQVTRIDELERQNKRLAKDAADAEKRWQKAEDALADARDGTSTDSPELTKLKSDIAALTRQNAQLQARSNTRHGSSPSMSVGSPPSSEFETQLKSKTQTIETMELEMSRLRAQVERLSVGGAGNDTEGGGEGTDGSGHGQQAQVAALEEKLERAEKAAGAAQRELSELKRNLDRTSEKAVKEGSARTSAETKLRTLEKERDSLRTEREELAKKVEGLEKKVTTLTTLHKEHDARSQTLRRDKEKADKDLADVRTRLERIEAENLRLRKSDARDGGGTDDEHLDELLASSPEASERIEQLDRRVRELEAENTDLRHGIWHERRKELQVGPDGDTRARHFSDVDLSPGVGASGKQKGHTGSVSGGGGALGDFFSVLTGGSGGGNDHAQHGHGHGHSHSHGYGHDDDGFLDDDEDMDFDEEAFRRAQEEEARQRLERVREAKRALKNWEGWRLDLVESRQGGAEGIGPIFEI